MTPKIRDSSNTIGRGAMCIGRSVIVRERGQYTRENAGMSSESGERTSTVENLRIPGEGQSSQGKSGPKPRANAVGDGQLVDIPVLPYTDKERCSDAGG